MSAIVSTNLALAVLDDVVSVGDIRRLGADLDCDAYGSVLRPRRRCARPPRWSSLRRLSNTIRLQLRAVPPGGGRLRHYLISFHPSTRSRRLRTPSTPQALCQACTGRTPRPDEVIGNGPARSHALLHLKHRYPHSSWHWLPPCGAHTVACGMVSQHLCACRAMCLHGSACLFVCAAIELP